MTFSEQLYDQDIVINDYLTLTFNSSNLFPKLKDQQIIFIAGLSGSGKSTLLKNLEKNLTHAKAIPERRIITEKGMIQPYASFFNLKCKFNKREDRIRIVKNYKKNLPEGIVYVLKNIKITKDVSSVFIFDGIRGEKELQNVLINFKNAKVIILGATKQTRLERILERNDPYDLTQNTSNRNVLKIVEDDLSLHGDFKEYKNKKIFNIDTNTMNQEEVFSTAYHWAKKTIKHL